MEKTPLESGLEIRLAQMGMPLSERVYAEDLDIEAELDDYTSPELLNLDMTDPIDRFTFLMNSSSSQLDRGEQVLLRRRSLIFKGLGFQYLIDAPNHNCGERGPSARRLCDRVISSRDFSDIGGEVVFINFEPDLYRQLQTAGRLEEEEIRRKIFYLPRFNFTVQGNNGIVIFYDITSESDDNSQYAIDKRKEILFLTPIFDRMYREFKGKLLDNNNLKRFLDYLDEIKKKCDENVPS
jgi:hypothetical protein